MRIRQGGHQPIVQTDLTFSGAMIQLSTSSQEWIARLSAVIKDRPVHSNPDGLRSACASTIQALRRLGFDVEVLGNDDPAYSKTPVLVARRPPSVAGDPWVIVSGHYDVEEVDQSPAEGHSASQLPPGHDHGTSGDCDNNLPTAWASDPFVPTIRSGRVYARGVGDNLGPLLLRFQVLSDLVAGNDDLPGILWIIHGDEEVGSPAAHALYPGIALPHPIAFCLEETGYFTCQQPPKQRLLFKSGSSHDSHLLRAVEKVRHTAQEHGVEVAVEQRYLNKANGAENCPYIKHIVRDLPYIAIGPNDVKTDIHSPNESIPTDWLDLSMAQFVELLKSVVHPGDHGDGDAPPAHQ